MVKRTTSGGLGLSRDNTDPHILLPWFDNYLAHGNGRGRLQSTAVIFEGKAGYFCIHRICVEGKEQDAIIFCCMPHDDVLLTALPQDPPIP